MNRAERDEFWRKNGGRPTSSNWVKRAGYNTTLSIPATDGERLIGLIKKGMRRSTQPRDLRTLCQEDGGGPVKIEAGDV